MLSPIKTAIGQKLRDKNYRHTFFKGRAQDELASDLRRFRQKRGLKQSTLAPLCGMKQSAISRIEQSSYSRWSFSTLLRIAEALDVRVRIAIDDAEDVIREYERLEGVGQVPGYAENTTSSHAAFKDHSTETGFLANANPATINPSMIGIISASVR